MQNSFSRVYLTTPIFYPSDRPHIGHAFTLVVADVLKRYYQLIKIDVFLLTGTDEHGEKILKKSQENNLSPQEFVDKNSVTFKFLCDKFKINVDFFARTSDEKHKKYVQNTFSKLIENENIYFGKWNGYYCLSCEENYSVKEYEKSPKCTLNHDLTHREEQTFFLKVKDFEKYLSDIYEKNSDTISPNWYTKELKNSFINNLEDLSLTRQKLNWGIKTIEKPEFTIYVWFDALLTYLSSDRNDFWDKKDTKIVQIIGKDILRFHAIYWPLIISFLNKKPYHKLIAHGWVLIDKQKMSKSLGNVVDPISLLDNFSLDVLRFFLINLNWELDNKFLLNDINLTNNTYLSNLFGNIIFRFFGLIKKNKNFVAEIDVFEPNEHLMNLDQKINDLSEKFKHYIISEDIPQLLNDLFSLLRDGNKAIDLLKPWTFEIDSNIYRTMMIIMYKISCFSVFILSPILVENATQIAEKLSFDIKNFDINDFKDIKNFQNKTTQEVSEPFFKRMDVNKE